MGQVIQVRLVAPDGTVLVDRICATSVKYDPTDQTPAHKEVIGLALKNATGGAVQIKRIERVSGPEHAGSGTTSSWRYEYAVYMGPIHDEAPDTEHACHGVLFAQYREEGRE